MGLINPEYFSPTSMIVGSESTSFQTLLNYESAIEKKYSWFAFEILSMER